MSLALPSSPFPEAFVPASVPVTDHSAALRGEFVAALPMRHAGLRTVTVRWECAGPPQAAVVVLAGGISAHRHVAANDRFAEKGWAEGLVGPGRTLDPQLLRVLAFDFIGADGTLDAPIDTADQADALALLLDHLSISRLQAFVGYSYGALVAQQFALRHRARVQRLVVVSGAHRAHPYAAAWRALQRRAVALGQLQCSEEHGLALARQFAMLSYRTPEEFSERFDAAPEVVNGRVRVAAEDYLDATAAQYVARTPVTAWLRLSESIDLHRVDPAQLQVPTVVVAVEGDRLVPLADLVTLVEGLGPRGSLRVLRSPYGHDAFLKETDRINSILATAIRLPGDTA
ncbi:homoserine O-succinyltransferase [Stenotrophomonas sp. C3(2023)]|uniref:homoserine O-succinyltransferase MetX n=1 Tax=Stenotrophomonas sp. C3(2023) TaxID=3080277 RepID=UPI00293D10F8|nr:homoserine O-succinyltransferase [Stenotrophomonas sp. C3(2023)]MDV3469364.1 homoserine O-succinyltransferase [Stenotrophomonas sp. C3(2023)]